MEINKIDVAHADVRGLIMDILLGQSVEHVALFTCRKNAVRGGHYHRESTAYVYVLSGKFFVRSRQVDGRMIEIAILPSDHLLTIPPRVTHTLMALEDSTFLMLTHGPNGGAQHLRDTVREAV